MSYLFGYRAPTTGSAIAVAAALMLSWGCSHDRPEPRMTPAAGARSQPEQPSEQSASEQPANRNAGYIEVSAGLRSRCNLPETRAESPQFDFDDSELRERGEGILDGVANCMLQGSLEDETVTVVGHADPRGTEEYNRGLGRRRADSARSYLMELGVPPERIVVRSRGEQEARGTGADTWQLDRRVEIEETTPTPGSP